MLKIPNGNLAGATIPIGRESMKKMAILRNGAVLWDCNLFARYAKSCFLACFFYQ
jgi:hypothetical protein